MKAKYNTCCAEYIKKFRHFDRVAGERSRTVKRVEKSPHRASTIRTLYSQFKRDVSTTLDMTLFPLWTKRMESKSRPALAAILSAISLLLSAAVYSQSSNQNYILTRTYSEDDNQVPYLEQIRYFDGLGRPVQTVQTGASPLGGDLVTYQEYDNAGRESNAWLPVAVQGNAGNFVPSGTFTGLSSGQYSSDAKAYSKPVYEASPLNRVLEQYGPGQEWQNNSKSMKTGYLTNTDSGELSCIYYYISTGGGLAKTGTNYVAYELSVVKLTDEDGHISYKFTDKQGRVVLTRRMNAGVPHDTYYVYDNRDNLCYVLPPILADKIAAGMRLVDTMPEIQQYAYIYKYDERNRCIKKRIPGCDWIEYVYDKADRLILSQDGEQRLKAQWTINKYDKFGRLIYTGLLPYNPSIWDIDYIRNSVVTETYVGNVSNNLGGYSCNFFGGGVITLLQANYYDNYDFVSTLYDYSKYNYVPVSGYGQRYTTTPAALATKGLLTGVLDNKNMLPTVYYYDERGRVIQTRKKNLLYGEYGEGYDNEYFSYNFTGQVTRRFLEHTNNSPDDLIKEFYVYTYDHAGRLTETTHQYSTVGMVGTHSSGVVSIEKNEYDELGRLKTTTPNNNANLKLTYNYNIRSWLTRIEGQRFNEELFYNTSANGSTPYYNGNISAMSTVFGTTTNTSKVGYTYTYDQLNRLTAARTTGPYSYWYYDSDYTYDKHGNITWMRQSDYNAGTVLGIEYNGNQMKTLTDEVQKTYDERGYYGEYAIDYSDFDDYSNDPNAQYTYNKNGAMTHDPKKGATFTYNELGMPLQVSVPAIDGTIDYNYSPTGEKLRATYKWRPGLSLDPVENTGINRNSIRFSTLRRDYAGNKVYENMQLDKILLPNGYIKNNNYYFYLRDHLGSTAVTAKSDGTSVQMLRYYPYGKINLRDSYGTLAAQPYKFGGKEDEPMHGLGLYDFHFRQLNYKGVPVWTQPDQHAESYYDWSPYAAMGNNPVRITDPTGMDWFVNNETGDLYFVKGSGDVITDEHREQYNLGDAEYERMGADDMFGEYVTWGIYEGGRPFNVLDKDFFSFGRLSQNFMGLQGYQGIETVGIKYKVNNEASMDEVVPMHSRSEYSKTGDINRTYIRKGLTIDSNLKPSKKSGSFDNFGFSNIMITYHKATVPMGKSDQYINKLNNQESVGGVVSSILSFLSLFFK